MTRSEFSPAPPSRTTLLHAEYSAGEGPPIVFLHGFMGQAADWADVARQTQMITGRATLCFDLPGHGASPLTDTRDWISFADALVENVRTRTMCERFDLVGYSMGGRLALVTSRLHPEAIRSLLIVGGHPGLQTPGARAERRFHDHELAGKLAADSDTFLDVWEQNPLFGAADTPAWDAMRKRRRKAAAGASFGWSEALRCFSLGGQPDCWKPTPDEPFSYFVAGQHDQKYCLISEQFAGYSPRRAFSPAPGAAHAVHLDRPDVVLRILGSLHRSLR